MQAPYNPPPIYYQQQNNPPPIYYQPQNNNNFDKLALVLVIITIIFVYIFIIPYEYYYNDAIFMENHGNNFIELVDTPLKIATYIGYENIQIQRYWSIRDFYISSNYSIENINLLEQTITLLNNDGIKMKLYKKKDNSILSYDIIDDDIYDKLKEINAIYNNTYGSDE